MIGDDPIYAERDETQFVAPCRKLSPWAPLRWLRLGVADLLETPQESLLYGLAVTLIIAIVCLTAWLKGSVWIMLAMLGGFVFLMPLLCVGLYATGMQIEQGQPALLAQTLRDAFKRHIGSEMVFAAILILNFLVWARTAVVLATFLPTEPRQTFADLWQFLAFGSLVGLVFAFAAFCTSVFSLPMILHRNADTITAIVTSFNAVLRNKRALLLWLAISVAGLLLGVVTAFVGLIVIIPVVGYGAWHGYRETIDADQFPQGGPYKNQ